ncbi:oligopeptidase A [Neptunomonas antarctica]|uniref:oligopeptidase A n=1 Tax=Neptunomonas antarctica TaxID=619304 RepID=A0A1N7IUS4_9GAMM|nr:oligopeptidase A [Neptunomonas antarctica]SIS40842.1 oligopeptidase A Metallo peptidase. MEROPS family M03A [Neptunomonas antarctica]
MSNPLLESTLLPPFSQIKPSDISPAVDKLLEQGREQIARLTGDVSSAEWDKVIAPLDTINDALNQAWSPVSHLNMVLNSDELREAYNENLPKLSAYWTEMGQNEGLFNAYRRVSEQSSGLDTAQKKVLEHNLRDFRLSGIDLPVDKKQRYADIRQRLSELSTKFSENVLDATQGWEKLITDPEMLKGMPEMSLAAAKQAAKAKEKEGYLLSLEFPSYFPVITHCDDRALRREVYEAYATRASDQGPSAGKWDNSEVMTEILTLRQEMSALLGFESYAHYSLATKMADTPEQVLQFLYDLADKSVDVARQEYKELCAFAKEEFGAESVESWDVSYYSEKLKQSRYALSQEMLRPYFPYPKVLKGMFEVAGRLFNIEVEEVADVDVWHPDARLFAVKRNAETIARFYLDPFARANKQGGAWMDDCRTRRRLEDGSLQLPAAYLVCNFNGPVGDDPALLTHNEVTTLFHEFGHGLHHMLTQMEYADVSGINGVAWDAVELPSQFMENWCWEPEALDIISGHYQTGETLPVELLDKMLAAKNFQSALMMVRQLELSIFDFKLHHEFEAGKTDIQGLLQGVRQQVAAITPPAFNRFQHSFSHIFGGGYAAGYYSYKWAEVLSADAFSLFEEQGVFNQEAGQRFRETVLENGGSKEPMELFVAFRGREPKVDALLKHSGINV